jgi:hypothetical protein
MPASCITVIILGRISELSGFFQGRHEGRERIRMNPRVARKALSAVNWTLCLDSVLVEARSE